MNRLRGKATLIFIAHHLPENLWVDRVLRIGGGKGGYSVLGPQRADNPVRAAGNFAAGDGSSQDEAPQPARPGAHPISDTM